MPQVSAVMSVYNGANALSKSIESVLGQSYGDFEFLIMNDGSADGTAEILNNYASKDARIKLFKQENRGLTKSLNTLISAASGKLIARQDADDISLPERFKLQAAYMEKNPDVGVVGTGYADVDGSGAVLRTNMLEFTKQQCREELIKRNFLCHSSIMFRKNIFEKAGGYDENYKYAQDYKLYFDIAMYSEIFVLPDLLVSKFINKGMVSWHNIKKQRACAARARFEAVRRGQYGLSGMYYIIRALCGNLLPVTLKRKLDKMRFGF